VSRYSDIETSLAMSTLAKPTWSHVVQSRDVAMSGLAFSVAPLASDERRDSTLAPETADMSSMASCGEAVVGHFGRFLFIPGDGHLGW